MDDFQRLKDSVSPNFIFHRAVIEDNVDINEKLLRCKVRILGIHTEDKTKLKTEDLPWAEFILPDMKGAQGVPEAGTWVWVFFDRGNENKPIIFGLINSINPNEIDFTKGFTDPNGVYPKAMNLGQSNTNRLLRVEDLDNTIHKSINDTLSETSLNTSAVKNKNQPTIESVMQGFNSNRVKLDFTNSDLFSQMDNYKSKLISSFESALTEFNPLNEITELENKLTSSIDGVLSALSPNIRSLVSSSILNTLSNIDIFSDIKCILNNLISSLDDVFNNVTNVLGDVEDILLKFKQSESTNDKSTYPNVSIQETPGGHIFEIDDTPGNKRIRQYHSSGSYQETADNGSVTIKSTNNHEKYVGADDIVKIGGNKVKHISGDNISSIDSNSLEVVGGNDSKVINGEKVEKTSGNSSTLVAGSENNFIAGKRTETINGLEINAGPKATINASSVHITKKVFLG